MRGVPLEGIQLAATKSERPLCIIVLLLLLLRGGDGPAERELRLGVLWLLIVLLLLGRPRLLGLVAAQQ